MVVSCRDRISDCDSIGGIVLFCVCIALAIAGLVMMIIGKSFDNPVFIVGLVCVCLFVIIVGITSVVVCIKDESCCGNQ